ncbi:MAG: Na+/H+ antiporter [Niabella sp.]
MENYVVIIFILAIMIGLSALADKIRIPYPVLLITGGIAMGYIPVLPHVEIEPDIIFLIFLPPLLYDAAFNISFRLFRTNIHTISTLAIGLVFLTTAAIAVFARYVIPGMNWPLAFVLGAILSATDAVAAISATKGLGLSHKTTTILEGESLVNDASALVAYRFAVSAAGGTAFVFWKAGLSFLVTLAGGFLVGIVMGKLLGLLLKRVKDNNMVSISFMMLMPFVTYLVAEELHVSGVIAVVILGLGISRFSRKIFPEHLKKESKAIWDIIIFLLNGLIFLLIGLQFPYIVATIPRGQLLIFTGYAFIITVIALLVRMARVFMQRMNLNKAFKENKFRHPIQQQSLLDFSSSLIISWSGMRGIVSLATALALAPDFPQRSTIVFIAVAVVLFTIVGQGLTLPWIVKKMNKKNLTL